MKIYLEYKLVSKLNTTINRLVLDAIFLGYVTISDIKKQYPFIYDQYLFSSINDLTDAGLIEINVINKRVIPSKSFDLINNFSKSNSSVEISDSHLKILAEDNSDDIKHLFFETLFDINICNDFKKVLRNINIIIKQDCISV